MPRGGVHWPMERGALRHGGQPIPPLPNVDNGNQSVRYSLKRGSEDEAERGQGQAFGPRKTFIKHPQVRVPGVLIQERVNRATLRSQAERTFHVQNNGRREFAQAGLACGAGKIMGVMAHGGRGLGARQERRRAHMA